MIQHKAGQQLSSCKALSFVSKVSSQRALFLFVVTDQIPFQFLLKYMAQVGRMEESLANQCMDNMKLNLQCYFSLCEQNQMSSLCLLNALNEEDWTSISHSSLGWLKKKIAELGLVE